MAKQKLGVRLASVVEALIYEANPNLSYDNRVEIAYPNIQKLDEFDWIELPDGTTFEKTFQPKKR